jgi:ABC-2 type transport system ATP-binding protein
MKITVDNVSKTIGSTMVIDCVSLELYSGKIYGFNGINGSGKTMLMRLISGLIYPTSGKVIVDGTVLQGENSFPPSIGLLIENPAFLNAYTGFQNLKMLASINGKISEQDVKQTLQRVGLNPNEKKKYKKYSLGMKQRLGIACAVMEKPDLIILDEPFISLEEDGITRVRDIIMEEKRRGALIVVACHDSGIMRELSDEIFFITAGKITGHIKNDNISLEV